MRGDTEFRQKSWPETCKELGINPELSPVEVEDKLLTAIYARICQMVPGGAEKKVWTVRRKKDERELQ